MQSVLEGIASELMLFVAGIVVGFIIGYIAGRRSFEGLFTNGMAVFIVGVWAFSVYQSAASGVGYTTPLYVHLIAGLVAGSLFAVDSETASSIATVFGRRAAGPRTHENDDDKK
jgi:xanthosine utilization system XapX-like protein